MITLEQLCLEIQNKYLGGYTWQNIAEDYGINRAMARLIALGYQPKNKIRTILGLPPVCPVCYHRLPVPPRIIKFDPVQMEAVIAFLRSHEKPTIRVYTRRGIHYE